MRAATLADPLQTLRRLVGRLAHSRGVTRRLLADLLENRCMQKRGSVGVAACKKRVGRESVRGRCTQKRARGGSLGIGGPFATLRLLIDSRTLVESLADPGGLALLSSLFYAGLWSSTVFDSLSQPCVS